MALGSKRIAVLIPAYNEGSQISRVLDSVPDYVDQIVVIDDASTDDTAAEAKRSAETDDRI